MGIPPGFSRFLSPQCAITRLQILYWCALALIACLLVMLHIALAGEQRLAHALTVETRSALAEPRVLVLRVPPVARAAGTKAKPNIRRAPAAAAAAKEK